jgi:D-alanyl-D-alanine carboxypeptidase
MVLVDFFLKCSLDVGYLIELKKINTTHTSIVHFMKSIKTTKYAQLFFGLIASLSLVSTSFAQNNTSAKITNIDSFVNDLYSYNKMMGSVAIMENGKLVYQKSVGFADVETKKKITNETRFRVGSITKTFTSTMIFQLIDEGKLELTTPLSKFFSGVKNAKEITLSQLLAHKSGIASFTSEENYESYMYTGKSDKEILSIIENLPSKFTPGERSSYSNSNYWLLGHIIELVTKDSYANQLTLRITKKLGLNNTYYGSTISSQSKEANSYSLGENSKPNQANWIQSKETQMGIPHGAGAIVSNPTDLLTFITALFENKLVSESSLNQMMTLDGDFARGLFVFPFYGEKAYGHEGAIDDFVNNLAYLPASKTAVVMMTNGLGDYSFNSILVGVLSMWFDKPFEMPNLKEQPISLQEDEVKLYTGLFSNPQLPFKLKLEADGAQLVATATGQQAIVLVPYSKTNFQFKPAGIVIEFPEQSFNTFTLKQGGGVFEFVKE